MKIAPVIVLGLVVSSLLSVGLVAAHAPAYDPLKIDSPATAAPLDLTVTDTARNREIPIRIYLPNTTMPSPIVLFSHGLGGSRNNNVYMGTHWSGRGYVGVFLQHPGSDTSVWQKQPLGQRMTAMNQAASLQNLMLRVKDVPAVLDQLERWNKTAGHPLKGRLDMAHIGMSGHSFGAVTTQAVSGERYPGVRTDWTDPRIKAALAFSPSGVRRGGANSFAFGSVAIPWMLMTGTKDNSPIGNMDAATRLTVYPALPPGSKYELVLDGAEHSAFSDRSLPGESRNPNYHRAILAISTAFWDAYLKGDKEAQAWLDGDGPRSVLEKADRWQRK